MSATVVMIMILRFCTFIFFYTITLIMIITFLSSDNQLVN